MSDIAVSQRPRCRSICFAVYNWQSIVEKSSVRVAARRALDGAAHIGLISDRVLPNK